MTEHHIRNGIGKRRLVVLRHHGNPLCHGNPGHGPDRGAVQQNLAAIRLPLAGQALKQGGLARPVRAKNGHDLSPLDLEVYLPEHRGGHPLVTKKKVPSPESSSPTLPGSLFHQIDEERSAAQSGNDAHRDIEGGEVPCQSVGKDHEGRLPAAMA